jgi:3-methyl-2-oxobutanoate hydroxymethyltransferase
MPPAAITAAALQARKPATGLPAQPALVCLTCYDFLTAQTLDALPDVDLLLVGDSLAMTQLGHANTLSVTMDEMLHHVRAVTRGASRALVVADLPFLSYQVERTEAVRNAGRMIQNGGAGAVKLEGASPHVLAVVRQLVDIGIPVMGHLGMTPQSYHALGGFKLQGKTLEAAQRLRDEALALAAAGAFAIVLELIPAEVAAWLTLQVPVPTVGIGAGPQCDGQILVIDDLLGRSPSWQPKFVRPYAQLADVVTQAVRHYCDDVRTGRFPDAHNEAFHLSEAERQRMSDSAAAPMRL